MLFKSVDGIVRIVEVSDEILKFMVYLDCIDLLFIRRVFCFISIGVI